MSRHLNEVFWDHLPFSGKMGGKKKRKMYFMIVGNDGEEKYMGMERKKTS